MENWIEVVSEPRKLFLAWQAPDHMGKRFRWAVGELEIRGAGLAFRYIPAGPAFEEINQGCTYDEALALGYTGYPAFSLKRKEHEAGVTEAFMSRLPPRNRPDFQDYKRQFCLAPDLTLSDFSLLAQTEAKLPSDGFSVVDPLNPEAERCDLMLEIAGYRYYCQSHTANVGQPVEILPEPENENDRNAVQIRLDGRKIGNINRLQSPTFLRWLADRQVSGVIQRLNGKAGKPRAFVFIRIRPNRMLVAA